MVTGIGYAGTEARQLHAATERQAGGMRRTGRLELVSAAEIVASREVKLTNGEDVETHDEVVEQLLR